MTNFQRWQLLLRDVPSPQIYIDFAFYYLIAAALQRRVWTGPDHYRLHANQFTILVGRPGIGKGPPLKMCEYMLKFFKLENPNMPKQEETKVVNVDPALVEAIAAANYAEATANGEKLKKAVMKKPLILPVAADATTYEALISAISKSTRRINYKKYDETLQKHTVGIYTHASICFCLEEISSLFRRKTEEVVNFLVKTYDCGDYEYDTISRGADVIYNSCVNFFGGTQPSFIERVFNDDLLNEGFASRCWFIYSSENRFNTLKRPELDSEQIAARNHLLEHIKKLTQLYGPIQFTQEAEEYMEDWWKNVLPFKRSNTSQKLDSYYSRRDIHTKKLALALHMGEDAEMNLETGYPLRNITLEEVKQAMDKLDFAEKTMHYALSFAGSNPLAGVAKRILTYIKRYGPQTSNELLCQFFDDITEPQLQEIINHLLSMHRIEHKTMPSGIKKWDITGQALP